MIRRAELGHLCGYVRVPRHHRLHGAPCKQRTVARLHVHGGVTWAGCLRGRHFKRGYWLGFDCGHCWDVVPLMEESLPPLLAELYCRAFPRRVYRTIDYVQAECAALAAQLAAMGTEERNHGKWT